MRKIAKKIELKFKKCLIGGLAIGALATPFAPSAYGALTAWQSFTRNVNVMSGNSVVHTFVGHGQARHDVRNTSVRVEARSSNARGVAYAGNGVTTNRSVASTSGNNQIAVASIQKTATQPGLVNWGIAP